MTLQAELDYEEQSRLDDSEGRFERDWFRPPLANPALSADAGTKFVRARMPTPRPEPDKESFERRVIDSPPLHGGDRPDRHDGQQSRRAGFLWRGPLALALALPLL